MVPAPLTARLCAMTPASITRRLVLLVGAGWLCACKSRAGQRATTAHGPRGPDAGRCGAAAGATDPARRDRAERREAGAGTESAARDPRPDPHGADCGPGKQLTLYSNVAIVLPGNVVASSVVTKTTRMTSPWPAPIHPNTCRHRRRRRPCHRADCETPRGARPGPCPARRGRPAAVERPEPTGPRAKSRIDMLLMSPPMPMGRLRRGNVPRESQRRRARHCQYAGAGYHWLCHVDGAGGGRTKGLSQGWAGEAGHTRELSTWTLVSLRRLLEGRGSGNSKYSFPLSGLIANGAGGPPGVPTASLLTVSVPAVGERLVGRFDVGDALRMALRTQDSVVREEDAADEEVLQYLDVAGRSAGHATVPGGFVFVAVAVDAGIAAVSANDFDAPISSGISVAPPAHPSTNTAEAATRPSRKRVRPRSPSAPPVHRPPATLAAVHHHTASYFERVSFGKPPPQPPHH